MRGKLNILDQSGDTVLEWSTEKADQDDGALDPEYVKTEFDRLVSEGHLMFNTDEETGESEQIKRFDPKVHTWVTASPQFVGG